MCGLVVFAFKLLAVPVCSLIKRVGLLIFICWRVGAAILVPAFSLPPQLSSLQSTGYPIIAASLVVLFTTYKGCGMVSVETESGC